MFDHRVDTSALLKVRSDFNAYWQTKDPEPRASTSVFVLWSLAVLVIASIVVSCSHTIPAFLATIEGGTPDAIKVIVAIAAFLMVEVSLLVFSYTNIHWQEADKLDEVSRDTVRGRLKLGLYSVLTLAIGANLYSTLLPRFGAAEWWDIFSFGVFVAVGASAPALAYIAGEVVAITRLLDARETSDARAVWIERREAEWDKVLARYNRVQLRGQPTQYLPEQTDQTGQTDTRQTDRHGAYQTFGETLSDRQRAANQTDGQTGRQTVQTVDASGDKLARAVRHYLDNPADMNRGVRTVGQELVPPIGKDTMIEAREQARQMIERAKIDGNQTIQ
jgi:hypothetical protein